ncbi:IS3 family transposase [Leptospira interrogans]|uniref:IS3-like element IS1501 family transposase n=1 Tax=Leptospira interrogans TaxID=173 RepID=UPI001EF0D90D|nr:IS3-like element IS1501 family transposase [Leptospira interrogans]ULG75785.1 IS3 family transposase [Leptospira interrogans]
MKGRRKYSPEFREQAVNRTLNGSFTIKEVAESLGVSYFVLRQWKAENLKKKETEQPLPDKQLKESEELKRLRKENVRLKDENANLKKVCGHAFPRTESRLKFMKSNCLEHSIGSMARVLGVSRSGYYKYLNRHKDRSVAPDLTNFLQEKWLKSRKNYGFKRLFQEVKKSNLPYGARKVRKAMKHCKISGKQRKQFRPLTTNSKHGGRIAPDLVQRKFHPNEQNRIWVSDVTFIRTSFGWSYLCVILDLYSRKIVGWSLSDRNDSQLVCDTVLKAVLSRNPRKGLIFHSDRGSNFCSKETRRLLIANGIRRSNSRKGNCWDNAVAESFFSSLKREIEYNTFYNIEEAEHLLFDFIEVYYNRFRFHSTLGYMSPEDFETNIA